MLVALAACEKSNDLGKLQEEAATVVANAKPELEVFARRSNEMLKLGRSIPASTPGIQPAGEALSEANGKIEQLRTLINNAPAEIERAAKTNVPDNVAAVIDNLRERIERDGRVINADLGTVEAWLDQHAPAG